MFMEEAADEPPQTDKGGGHIPDWCHKDIQENAILANGRWLVGCGSQRSEVDPQSLSDCGLPVLCAVWVFYTWWVLLNMSSAGWRHDQYALQNIILAPMGKRNELTGSHANYGS